MRRTSGTRTMVPQIYCSCDHSLTRIIITVSYVYRFDITTYQLWENPDLACVIGNLLLLP